MRYRRAGLARGLASTAVLAALAAATTACGSGDSGTTADGKIELTVATFNEFGYEELFKEYEAAHPNIKITPRKVGQAAPHHQNLFTKLGAGSGLADIEAVEEGYLSQVMAKSGQFNDLKQIGPSDVREDRWLQWKTDAVTTKDDKLIGYGTDIGPLAMCYRKDLLEAANIKTDPESIKATFATWDSYFAAGEQYVKATGKPWFDSASQVFNAMHNQHKTGYYDRDDNLVIESNSDIKSTWDKVTKAVAQGQSAKLVAWSDEWETGFKNSAFATRTCPSWMLGVIESNAGPEHKGHWAVTGSFPGGGGNWGGSYLTVPKQSKHPKEAAELAGWLTAPQQQIKAFVAKGTFPSQTEALLSPELLNKTSDYFGGEKVGQLFSEQANKVAGAQYKGPKDGDIQDNVISPALLSVEQGGSPEDGWKQAVEGAKKAAK
ncbi:ABC transporter substrate-binding protein [Saccharothrix coeruleofusca]|uniref:Sugar ABC transporter substrate-binding protein n=1 Tax=Saccharothrix coeruleofusca TaxID=33919 RepID=A0A918EFC8_9PSEU|nr:ABC transporter substrate-binding protein [Saccharothrix coeruleofusca]MBP2335256.1 cellobiose transport system substrate-binding protein [Saccharothrix coeruleofusca]GGP71811.1 sugar ABC transporter substrate-binding protein [Saccharothrix coeruleofusca]